MYDKMSRNHSASGHHLALPRASSKSSAALAADAGFCPVARRSSHTALGLNFSPGTWVAPAFSRGHATSFASWMSTVHLHLNHPAKLKAVWQKTVVNCVFNSICPLLESDNGVFDRESKCIDIAIGVIRECVAVARGRNIVLDEKAILEQIHLISSGSKHLISTLQDLRNGRSTEIEFLNLEVARIAASLDPQINVPYTELLGRLIDVKSQLGMSAS
jgi:ketopantoate reductase